MPGGGGVAALSLSFSPSPWCVFQTGGYVKGNWILALSLAHIHACWWQFCSFYATRNRNVSIETSSQRFPSTHQGQYVWAGGWDLARRPRFSRLSHVCFLSSHSWLCILFLSCCFFRLCSISDAKCVVGIDFLYAWKHAWFVRTHISLTKGTCTHGVSNMWQCMYIDMHIACEKVPRACSCRLLVHGCPFQGLLEQHIYWNRAVSCRGFKHHHRVITLYVGFLRDSNWTSVSS